MFWFCCETASAGAQPIQWKTLQGWKAPFAMYFIWSSNFWWQSKMHSGLWRLIKQNQISYNERWNSTPASMVRLTSSCSTRGQRCQPQSRIVLTGRLWWVALLWRGTVGNCTGPMSVEKGRSWEIHSDGQTHPEKEIIGWCHSWFPGASGNLPWCVSHPQWEAHQCQFSSRRHTSSHSQHAPAGKYCRGQKLWSWASTPPAGRATSI